MLYLSNNLKEKKRKRKEILNNDLAILPSYDIYIPRNKTLRTEIIRLHHDMPVGGHGGQ